MALLVSVTVSCPAHACVGTTIRFRNRREVVVRDYWRIGDWVLFSYAGGTVGVPRDFVAGIATNPAPATIKGTPGGVNATPAPARHPFVPP
jgi:hypothetical protein